MHHNVLTWVEYVLDRTNVKGKVIEIGSRNWNGMPRHLFENFNEYIGVDFQAGDGVDIVADGTDLRHLYPDGSFEVVLCLEVLEHSDKKAEIVSEMSRLSKPNGIGIITAGAPGRPEHDGGTDFYENVTPAWLVGQLSGFSEWGLELGPNEAATPDIRGWFRK